MGPSTYNTFQFDFLDNSLRYFPEREHPIRTYDIALESRLPEMHVRQAITEMAMRGWIDMRIWSNDLGRVLHLDEYESEDQFFAAAPGGQIRMRVNFRGARFVERGRRMLATGKMAA
jgi:hypothetical protein